MAAVPGADAWRHVPPRRDRPARQHGLGHAQRRLAVRLAGRAGARLPRVRARPDVLARPGPPERARAGQTAADDAHAGRSRCATASRTSRSARPAATSRTSGRCTRSCAHVHHGQNLQQAIDAPSFHTRAPAELVLPARVAARPPRRRGDVRARHAGRARPARAPARDRAPVATTTRSRWRRGPAGRCAPAPARAGSRASRSVASPPTRPAASSSSRRRRRARPPRGPASCGRSARCAP